ncbi:MAG: hypothetical protein GXP48_00200, partial [Acidobacteria bacterium]|nr:hypothetical protein [Acidobacteriota bacterium]
MMRARPLALVVLGMMLAGCGGRTTAPPRPAPAVTTAPAATRRVEVTLPFLGHAEAARTVRLVARAEARIVHIAVRDGADVRAGQRIFELGGPRAKAAGGALQAGVTNAQQAVTAAEDRLA